MTTSEKIRKNVQTILILCRGLDARKYAQIAASLKAVTQMLDTLEALGAKAGMASVLEAQLADALAKQEELIVKLAEIKKKPGRQAKTTDADTPEGE